MGQDLLAFPAQRKEMGHAVETEAKPRAEVIIYHLAADSRWAEHCNLFLAPQIEHSLSQQLSTLIKNTLGDILQL